MFSENKREIIYDGDTKCFLMFANSLKLIRRAEIEHEGENIIDEIYTDLLPNEGILQQVNLPRTSILKGRKGTGKSTIFQKSIADMKGNKDVITVYIDVKTLFDSATPTLSGTLTTEMSEEIKKYLIYKNFLFEVIKLAIESFKSSIKSQNVLSRIAHSLNGTIIEAEEELSEILDNINEVVKAVVRSYTRLLVKRKVVDKMRKQKLMLISQVHQ